MTGDAAGGSSLKDLDTLFHDLAAPLREAVTGLDQPVLLIGLETGGVWVRDRLIEELGVPVESGSLDISFFRDDYSSRGLPDSPKASQLPISLDDRHLVLIDDAIHTGRSIRAAMNAVFERGRPRSVQLAVLVDRGGRDLPIQPDYCGQRITLPDHQRVVLSRDGSGTLSIGIEDQS